MSKRLLGGKDLLEVAEEGLKTTTTQPTPLPERASHFAGSRMALRPSAPQMAAREASVYVDPKRCKPWKFHDRHESWYTPERCADLIESIPAAGQRFPGLVRKITHDPNFDYEVIYGMRRRYACEVTGKPFRVVITDASDADCAVYMHMENAEREDITPMERALSWVQYLKAGLFKDREEMSQKLRIQQGRITKMTYAAALFEHPTLTQLFPNPSLVPIENAYKVAALLQKDSIREVVIQAAKNLLKSADYATRAPKDLLRVLATAPQRSEKTSALSQDYNLGKKGRVEVKRNAKGKVTFAFRRGFADATREEYLDAMSRIYDELAAR